MGIETGGEPKGSGAAVEDGRGRMARVVRSGGQDGGAVLCSNYTFTTL